MPEVAIFLARAQRLRHGRAPRQGARRGQHGPAAAHEARRGRGGARPRDEPRRERRHDHADPDPGRGEHLRHLPVARDRPPGRSGRLPARTSAATASATSSLASWRRSCSASSPARSSSGSRGGASSAPMPAAPRLAGRESMIRGARAPEGPDAARAAFPIRSPRSASRAGQAASARLFMTHPPLEERIAASRWWLHHSLAALAAALRTKGVALTLRRGPTLSALTELAREVGATKVVWNRLYVLPPSRVIRRSRPACATWASNAREPQREPAARTVGNPQRPGWTVPRLHAVLAGRQR